MDRRAVLLSVATIGAAALLALAITWKPSEPKTQEPGLGRGPSVEASNTVPPTEVVEPPPLAPDPTLALAPESKLAREAKAPPAVEPESEAAFKKRTFKNLLDQFDGKPLEKPDWPGFDRQKLTPMLMMMSVAAHMDAAGTSKVEPQDGQPRRVYWDGDVKYDCEFLYNNRTYRFMKGDFPVYDEYIELNRLNPATQASFSEPEPPRGFSFPEDFFVRASEFAHDALALRP